MLLILILLVLTGVLLFLANVLELDILNFFGVIGMVLLIVYLVTLPLVYYGNKSDINSFNIVQKTVTEARLNNKNNIENTALQLKIISENEWLANIKYWNNSLFDWYVPDEVDTMKYLK